MKLQNNGLVLNKSDPDYGSYKSYLIKLTDSGEVLPLYVSLDNGDILIPRGLLFLIPHKEVEDDETTHELDIELMPPEAYKTIIEGINLRDDQILAVMKSLLHKHGICQMSTGSGKTIVMAAILKSYYEYLGFYPTTVVFEPTKYLVNDMVDRFNSYGIPAQSYTSGDQLVEGVVITHPRSIYSDLMSNLDLLCDVKIFLSDECHHQACNTWSTIHRWMTSLEVSIGVSASVFSPSQLPIERLSNLSYEEATLLGCTGNILVNYDPAYYISRGILAQPVLIRLHNPAKEWVPDTSNWNLIRKFQLESDYRVKLVCGVATMFNAIRYKVLILVDTRTHAYKIAKTLIDYGVASSVIMSFGSGEYRKIDPTQDKFPVCKNEDPKEKYASGEYRIMIGTTHLYEGADVPNLDAVVLASVGKQSRRLIQGVGRSLRRSKTGKYAYIFDFTDHESGVLKYHSNLRMENYKELIGITEDFTYDYATLNKVSEILQSLEID